MKNTIDDIRQQIIDDQDRRREDYIGDGECDYCGAECVPCHGYGETARCFRCCDLDVHTYSLKFLRTISRRSGTDA